MLTTVTGTLAGEPALLRWEDGHVDGTQPALDLLLAARGEQRASAQWPSVDQPDVTRHLDFTVTAWPCSTTRRSRATCPTSSHSRTGRSREAPHR